MRELSIKIMNAIFEDNGLDKSMYSVYQYGIQMALEIGCSFVTSVLICYIYRMLVEGFVFFLIFIPIRSYLGGYHMKHYWACFLCSCFTLIMILTLVKYICPNIICIWGIISISLVIILRAAYKQREVDDDGRYYYPKICFIILGVLVFALLLTIFNNISLVFLIACTCLLVAVSKILE